MEAVLSSGLGINSKEASDNLHTVRRCLGAVEKRVKAKGCGEDVRQMFKYATASTEARNEGLTLIDPQP